MRILISAGEVSGDRLGAGLAEALLRRHPDAELIGMGGDRMRRAGVRLVQDAAAVSVVGIFEVLSHLGPVLGAMRRLERCIAEERPDLVVPIDFPDFNLRLAKRARRAGVDVVYFVSPQVWAWRRGRVHQIRGLVRRMLVLFPFETAFYEEAGVPVSFVGHPLAEHSTVQPGPAADAPRVVALMPGSRRSEVERLLPSMLDAAGRLRETHPGLQFLVSHAPGLPAELLSGPIARSAVADARIHAGDFPEILSTCEAGVVASGTASLEAAATGLPIVVVYRMNPLSYAVGRMLVRLEDIALPNLVAGRRVVPELIQGECTGARIAEELGRYLDDRAHAAATRRELSALRSRLGGAGVYDRAAEAILSELS